MQFWQRIQAGLTGIEGIAWFGVDAIWERQPRWDEKITPRLKSGFMHRLA
jgi:hypothetical protein